MSVCGCGVNYEGGIRLKIPVFGCRRPSIFECRHGFRVSLSDFECRRWFSSVVVSFRVSSSIFGCRRSGFECRRQFPDVVIISFRVSSSVFVCRRRFRVSSWLSSVVVGFRASSLVFECRRRFSDVVIAGFRVSSSGFECRRRDESNLIS